MFRSDLNTRDKSGAIAAAIGIQAALLLAFINLAGKLDSSDAQPGLQLIDIKQLVPPPPAPEPKRQDRLKEGASAPVNIKSEATPVIVPKPKIELPPENPMVASPTPRRATQPTQGNSTVAGSGTGAGGQGNATGIGAAGFGPGSGDNGVVEPPHLASPVLRGADFQRELLDEWPHRATVFLRLRVDPRGYVSECMVDRGTGVQSIDTTMCNLAHERLRFYPAMNSSGEPVAGWFGYAQPAPR